MARAIIAAARAYGDDPVKAVTSTAHQHRRALTAVADALSVPRQPFHPIERMLQVKRGAVYAARCGRAEAYVRARTAAERAIAFAGWRPEAAESVAGPELPADLASAPEPDRIEPEPPLRIPVEFDEPWLPAEAPVDAAPAKRGPAGPVSSWLQMPQPVRTEALGSERLLADLVFEALAGGPLNSMSLSTLIDRKEMAVSSALNQLAHLGLVASEPCETGPRKLVWRRLDNQEAAA